MAEINDGAENKSENELLFESPITTSYPASSSAVLVLTDESAVTKVLVRAADDTAAAAQLGVRFGSSRSEAGVLICATRPTEWLLVGDAAAVNGVAATLDRTGHVSVIDLTHGLAIFRITGDDSARLLEKVCGLDFDDTMTPDGAVVSASVAKVTCDLVRNDQEQKDQAGARSYRLACDRSFAQYLFDGLLDAGREFGVAVGKSDWVQRSAKHGRP